MMDVRAWPCDPASPDWNQGPTLANNQGGLSGGGGRVAPTTLKWEGISWRCASTDSTLFVLAPDRNMVEAHRPALERLAAVVIDRGGLEKVRDELARSNTGALVPRTAKMRNAGPKDRKAMALSNVTQSIIDAIEAGATAKEIRLAFFSALGLEDL